MCKNSFDLSLFDAALIKMIHKLNDLETKKKKKQDEKCFTLCVVSRQKFLLWMLFLSSLTSSKEKWNVNEKREENEREKNWRKCSEHVELKLDDVMKFKCYFDGENCGLTIN